MQTYHNFFKISILSVIKCTNVNCKFIKYRNKIDLYDSEICKALHCSILDSIPSSKSSEGRDYITKFTFLRLRKFCTLKCLKSHLFNTNIFNLVTLLTVNIHKSVECFLLKPNC